MKITPAMLEAGVAAMARIKKQKPQDAAVVNTVFSAMYSAMETEKKRLAGLETPKPYEHQDWPAWVYGPDGQSVICASEAEMPEGWSRHQLSAGGGGGPAGLVAITIAQPKRKYTKRSVDGPNPAH